MGVTSSRNLTFVIGGHTIDMGWPTKKHKVLQSYSHCVARLSYWAAHHSHCVARLSHWAAHHSHCVARLSHWAAHLSHCAAHHRHGVPTVVLGEYTIVDAISRSASGYLNHLYRGANHLELR